MEASHEFQLATRLMATAGNGALDPADVNYALPDVPQTVSQLLTMAKPPVPLKAMAFFVVVAFILTIFTLIVAAIDAFRGFLVLRRRASQKNKTGASATARSRQDQDLHLLEEEDAPTLLGSGWRPFYSSLVMVASTCQAVYLLLYIQGSRGVLPRQLQFSASNVAFASSTLASLFLVLATIPSSPTTRRRIGSTMSNIQSGAWHYTLISLVSLAPALVIFLMMLGSQRYLRSFGHLDSALRTLIAQPAVCSGQQTAPGNDTSSPCSVYTIAFLLEHEGDAAKANLAFKAILLLCLGVLTAIVGHEALRALRYRQALLTDTYMQLEQTRLESETLDCSSMRSQSSASSYGPAWKSTSSSESGTQEPIRKPPPSYYAIAEQSLSFPDTDEVNTCGLNLDTPECASLGAEQGATVVGETTSDSDEDIPRLPGFLNPHITRPEAVARRSHDDYDLNGLTRIQSPTQSRRLESSVRPQSLNVGDIYMSNIAPTYGSGRRKPRGGRPMRSESASSFNTFGSRCSSSPSTSTHGSQTQSSVDDSCYPWYDNGYPSSLDSNSARTSMAQQSHSGSLALTLSAAAASSSTAALARTAPLRSRMRMNRAMALTAVALSLVVMVTMFIIGHDLEFGSRPLVELVLTIVVWFLESGLHLGVLVLLILRGSGAVEEISLACEVDGVPDLEQGCLPSKEDRI
ncbi:hypothetical protein CF327_g3541 [Tilletia walkeri]|nr:hypothetical protein CF327_g3541 [Tilletia walkeri]